MVTGHTILFSSEQRNVTPLYITPDFLQCKIKKVKTLKNEGLGFIISIKNTNSVQCVDLEQFKMRHISRL
jgi:hypothetical protein